MQLVDPLQTARFKFIDFLLHFKGKLTRSEIVCRFGIGEATASRTIASYIEINPEAVVFLGSRNGYIAAEKFISAENHLAEDGLRYLAYGKVEETFLVETFGTGKVTIEQQLDARLIGSITRTMVNSQQVLIEYSSASSGKKTRILSPHSLFESSGSWYFRAYDFSVSEYRTFKFTRVVSAIPLGGEPSSKFSKSRDSTWNRIRNIHLIPHPNSNHPDSQFLDLGLPGAGQKTIAASEACLGFLLNDLRVDCSKTYKLDSKQYPLALKNIDELYDIESMKMAPGFCIQRNNSSRN
ncbi:WYL domain-containing protein [uncultured Tolumonas sp.]|uniref:WYL domain-containing protein n=1 Tax=uncultured Tolumonas sp. TaxID=263765 RepID=UPI002A0A1EF5|nr:WYL domain-containing protein [uncultured Tolumonas sp.]